MKTAEEVLNFYETETGDRLFDRYEYNERVIIPAMKEYSRLQLQECIDEIEKKRGECEFIDDSNYTIDEAIEILKSKMK